MFNLGDMFLRVLADLTQFDKQVQQQAQQSGDKAGKTLGQRISQNIGKIGGAAFGAGLVTATDAATKFEDQLKTIQTVAQGIDLKVVGDQILALSRETGKSTDDLTSGFYDLVSAGVSADDAIKVLKDSAILATGALGTTGESVDLVTSSMNAFGLEAKDSARITDIWATAVADGKTTVAGLAQGFDRVAPIAHAAGISLEEVAAATTVMTLKGASASKAYSDIQSAINALLTPNAALLKLQDKLGVKFADVAKEKGLTEALKEMRDATHGDDQAFAQMLGSSEALTLGLSITGENAADMSKELGNIQQGADKGGVALKQYEIKSSSAAEQGKRLVAQVQSFLITVGGPFVSSIGPAVFALNQLGGAFGANGILAKAFGATIGAVAGGAIQKLGPAVGLGFQKLLTAAVVHVQIPAQMLAQRLGSKFVDVFSSIGDSSGAAFAKKFAANQGVQSLGSTIGKAASVAFAAALVVEAIDTYNRVKGQLEAQAKDIGTGVGAQIADGTTEELQRSRAGIQQGLSELSGILDFGLVTGDTKKALQAQLDQINAELVRRGKEFHDNGREAGVQFADGTAEGAAEAFRRTGQTYVDHGREAADGYIAGQTDELANVLPRELGPKLGGAITAAAAAATPAGQAAAHRLGLLSMQGLKQGFQDGREAVNQQWSSFLDILKNAETPAKERARLLGELTSKELQKGLKSGDPYVRATAETTKQTIIDRLNVLKTSANNIGKAGMAELRKGMKSKDPDIRAAATAIYNAARHGTSGNNGPADAADNASTWGANIDKGLASGMRAHVNLVASAADAIAKAIGNQLVISSPAEEGILSLGGGPEGWGKNIGVDMARGLRSTARMAGSAASYYANAIIPAPAAAGIGYHAPATFYGSSGMAGLDHASSGSAQTVVNVKVDGLMQAKDPFELAQRLQRFASTGVFNPQPVVKPGV